VGGVGNGTGRTDSLPECVGILILQALGSKAELERGNGPLGKVANVRPWQHWWPPNCVHHNGLEIELWGGKEGGKAHVRL